MDGDNDFVAVKRQCAGSTGKAFTRATFCSPRERGIHSPVRRRQKGVLSENSESVFCILSKTQLDSAAATMIPVQSSELGWAVARRLIMDRDCKFDFFDSSESIDENCLSGLNLEWILAMMQFNTQRSDNRLIDSIQTHFMQFLDTNIYDSIKTSTDGVANIPLEKLWEFFLWLSSCEDVRIWMCSTADADAIVKAFFTSLSGTHKNAKVKLINVLCHIPTYIVIARELLV